MHVALSVVWVEIAVQSVLRVIVHRVKYSMLVVTVCVPMAVTHVEILDVVPPKVTNVVVLPTKEETISVAQKMPHVAVG